MADPFRGFLLDSARCLESRAYYRRFLEFCSARAVNTVVWHFTDDQGCTLRFDAMPEIASPNAYSTAEMRELIAFAKSLGITLIPELETLGHSRYITGLAKYRYLLESTDDFTAICPLHEDTRRIMSDLLEEVADVFDSPWIHVGLDEVNFGHHPLTRAALASRTETEIFLDYVYFIHDKVTSLGRRMILWGDRQTVRLGLAPRLPKDVIVANWQYSPEISAEQVRHFLNEGLDVILCPALITYDQQFLPSEELALSNVRAMSRQLNQQERGKILGIVTTVWTGTRYLHDAQWCGLHVACDMMAGGPTVEVSASVERFTSRFYGCNGNARALNGALGFVLEHAPVRQEYQALLTIDRLDALDPQDVAGKAREWTAIKRVLLSSRASVRTQIEAYETFVLAVEFMAHLYERAVVVRSVALTNDRRAVERMCHTGENLYQRMLETWDRERFASDPKKFDAEMDFDRSENVLLAFRRSIEAMTKAGEGSSLYADAA